MRFSLLSACATMALAGCGASGSPDMNRDQTGFLSLGISDGPMHDADKVCIAFDEIELKGEGSPITIFAGESEGDVVIIDLLDFQGANASPLLFNEEVPAGDYQWLRLGVIADRGSMGGAGPVGEESCVGEHSYVQMADGSTYNVYIPSGDQTGLKFVNGVTIPANRTATYTAEFDLMLSFRERPGPMPDVRMRPTVRLVNNIDVGTLTGQVDSELTTAEACEPSVYVFDDGVTPNPPGLEGDPEADDPLDPIATAMVQEHMNEDGTTTWDYTIGFLLAGDYEAAYTCDGETFNDEDVKPATIVAQEVTTVNFP